MISSNRSRTAHATAQLIGDRSHQCDATATATGPNGARAFVLLDGIGSSDEIRDWTRRAARRLARSAAYHGDAETGLRAVYDRYAAEPERQGPWADMPTACAVVAVHTPGKLTVAWCGDARAYVLTHSGALHRLTNDHNMRRVAPAWGSRNRVTSWLGSELPDERVQKEVGHPAIETAIRYPARERLLLASDGAYEPLEDSCRNLANYLIGSPTEAARDFTQSAIDHTGEYADNATALVADLG
jgi:serine/threonine protein phosphatase PrpC